MGPFTTVLMLSPLEDKNDKFRENFNIVIQDLSKQPMNLDDYTTLSLGQIKQYFTNEKIIASKEVMLANCKGYLVIYTGKQGQFD